VHRGQLLAEIAGVAEANLHGDRRLHAALHHRVESQPKRAGHLHARTMDIRAAADRVQNRQRCLHLALHISADAKARVVLREANHARKWLHIGVRRAEQNSCGVGEHAVAICALNFGKRRARREGQARLPDACGLPARLLHPVQRLYGALDLAGRVVQRNRRLQARVQQRIQLGVRLRRRARHLHARWLRARREPQAQRERAHHRAPQQRLRVAPEPAP
jgi:hypothetical protein